MHGQKAHGQLEVWLIGVVNNNNNTRFVVRVSHAMRFKANTSKFFAVSDGLMVLIAGSDAEI